MKRFEDGTSSVSSTAKQGNSGEDMYNLFKSPTFFHKFHFLFSLIWRLLGWFYGVRSSFQHQRSSFETHAFGKMCNLRILRLNHVQLNGSYKNFPEGLRWLCMHGFPLTYITSDLRMANMVALDMSNSNLQQLWKKPRKLLESLKFLNLSCCRELVSVGHFSGLPSLQKLILAGCTSLVELDESIGNSCDRLEVLDLSACNKLKKLPSSMGKLKKLRKLSINGCSNLDEFPCEIKDMESLQVLEANNINKESKVSCSTINNMNAIQRSSKSFVISLPSLLVSLSLKNNNLSNESFPTNFSSLSMLKSLYLDENPIESLPDFVRSLTRLEFLSLRKCPRLTTVLSVPSTIKHLFTSKCYSLDKITLSPKTSTAPNVRYIHSDSITKVQGMFKVQDVAETDEDVLHSLDWINIKEVKDFPLRIMYIHQRFFLFYTRKMCPVQMIYEYGVFSAFFQGQELPYWITYRSRGSSISITIPSCPKSCRIRGLNVCIMMTLPEEWDHEGPSLTIRNLTKKRVWDYIPSRCAIPKASEGIVWLSHWIFENNEFEDGNEVSFHYQDYYVRNFVHPRECGMSVVYDEESKKEDPLSSYKAGSRIAGQDLSAFDSTRWPFFMRFGE